MTTAAARTYVATRTVSTPRTVAFTAQDWDDLMDTAGYGIAYWATRAVVADDSYTVTDGEDGGTHVVTPLSALDALLAIAYGDPAPTGDYLRRMAVAAIEAEPGASVDLGEVDADLADCIVQVAIFGELVYG